MKTVEWNINNYVTVELCEYGIEIYEKYLYNLYTTVYKKVDDIEQMVEKKITDLHVNNRKLRLQGWAMINIFGDHTYLGSQPIFKECIWNVEVDK